jgi:hypothetical protein
LKRVGVQPIAFAGEANRSITTPFVGVLEGCLTAHPNAARDLVDEALGGTILLHSPPGT